MALDTVYANTIPVGADATPITSHDVSTMVLDREVLQQRTDLVRRKMHLEEQLEDTSTTRSVIGIAEPVMNLGTAAVPLMAKSAPALGTVAKSVTPIGNAVTTGFTVINADHQTKKEYKELIRDHLPLIQERFGINDPSEASEKHIRALAETHPNLQKEIDRIDKHMPRSLLVAGGSMLAVGGAAVATGGMSLLPTIGISVAASLAGSKAAEIGFDTVAGYEPTKTGQKAAKALEAKLDEGVPVNALEVFDVLSKNNDVLQAQIKKDTGKKFENLSEQRQEHYLQTARPGLMAASEQLAIQLNTGETEAPRLLTLNWLALEHGADAVRAATANDLMSNTRQNLLEEGAPQTPDTQVQADGATLEPMQGQGIRRIEGAQGAHSAAVLNGQQQGVGVSQHI